MKATTEWPARCQVLEPKRRLPNKLEKDRRNEQSKNPNQRGVVPGPVYGFFYDALGAVGKLSDARSSESCRWQARYDRPRSANARREARSLRNLGSRARSGQRPTWHAKQCAAPCDASAPAAKCRRLAAIG